MNLSAYQGSEKPEVFLEKPAGFCRSTGFCYLALQIKKNSHQISYVSWVKYLFLLMYKSFEIGQGAIILY